MFFSYSSLYKQGWNFAYREAYGFANCFYDICTLAPFFADSDAAGISMDKEIPHTGRGER